MIADVSKDVADVCNHVGADVDSIDRSYGVITLVVIAELIIWVKEGNYQPFQVQVVVEELKSYFMVLIVFFIVFSYLSYGLLLGSN